MPAEWRRFTERKLLTGGDTDLLLPIAGLGPLRALRPDLPTLGAVAEAQGAYVSGAGRTVSIRVRR